MLKMMDNKNINVISEYRGELMGVATLMIVVGHAISLVNFPSIINKILAYGSIGVDVFLFLSGIGLYYSLKQNNDKIFFYKKRFNKVFVTYFFIAGLWYGIKYLIFEKGKVVKFLYELSTLSFWNEHLGAWYVALLIPLYLVYPFYYNYLEKKNRHKYIYIYILMTLFIVSFVINKFNLLLYIHLSQVLVGIIIFVIGDYVAPFIYMNTFNCKKLLLFSIIFFIVKTLTPLKNNVFISDLAASFLGIVIVILGSLFLRKFSFKRIKKILKITGEYSLESYLYNIFLLQSIKYFNLKNKMIIFQNTMTNEMIIYLIVIISGGILSIVTKIIIEFFKKLLVLRRKNENINNRS